MRQTDIKRNLTLVAAGDAMIARRVSARESDVFTRLVEQVRNADAAVVNLETTVHDFEGYPAADAGMYMRSSPKLLDDLTWMGFDLFTAANNHAGDFSHGGMEATMRELDERNLPYAGLGQNLADARSPAYFDTPAGRVALVAACSTYNDWTVAGPTGQNIQGRPGISPVEVENHYVVPEETMTHLRELSEALGLELQKQRNSEAGFPHPDTDEEFHFQNLDAGTMTFRTGDEHEFERQVNKAHAEAILDQIQRADRQADWVLASLHTHEGPTGHFGDHGVPAFVESFARDCIEVGADAFLGHGPHVIRGVEIYDDSPIFYSLGDFVLHEESVTRLPGEMYRRYDIEGETPADVFDKREELLLAKNAFWESFLPVCEFDDNGIEAIRLYPLDLEPDRPRSRRGTPVVASGERAEKVLTQLADLSGEYGTEITVEGGVGEVKL